jgi:hypothetical protein
MCGTITAIIDYVLFYCITNNNIIRTYFVRYAYAYLIFANTTAIRITMSFSKNIVEGNVTIAMLMLIECPVKAPIEILALVAILN